jgi:hypothetical protein
MRLRLGWEMRSLYSVWCARRAGRRSDACLVGVKWCLVWCEAFFVVCAGFGLALALAVGLSGRCPLRLRLRLQLGVSVGPREGSFTFCEGIADNLSARRAFDAAENPRFFTRPRPPARRRARQPRDSARNACC